MRPRWLLLGVSVLCLAMLFPAAAMSQGPTLSAGCGTATLDGHVRTAEWANAATGALQPFSYLGNVYFMNDEQYLYVGTILNDPHGWVPDDPESWILWMSFAFEDEPAGQPDSWVDCTWEATSCAELEDEGFVRVWAHQGDITPYPAESEFVPYAVPNVQCGAGYVQDVDGLDWAFEPRGGGAHYEMRVNLDTSPLNNVDPSQGQCFGLRGLKVYFQVEEPDTLPVALTAQYPSDEVGGPPFSECSMLCLDPCDEEFVPESGTIMLLASGLAGLAGYATLRWRTRE
jgi:hypothetical protein